MTYHPLKSIPKAALTNKEETASFWKVAFSWQGSATPRVLGTVLTFCLYAVMVDAAHYFLRWPKIDIMPFEVFGAVLGVLMVFRTNAGYDRWWEARKIWGGIVNQSRNLVLVGLEYGPKDAFWRSELVKWTSAFSFSCKSALRDTRDIDHIKDDLTPVELIQISNAEHIPIYIAGRIARLTRIARTKYGMDGYAFLEMEKHRAALIDYIGACERIRKTPMPLVYAIKVRRLILIYLLTLPFAIAPIAYWLAPVTTLFVAYPLLSLDIIGMQLQNPFRQLNLSHLPLGDICNTIKSNLQGVLEEKTDVEQAFVEPMSQESGADVMRSKQTISRNIKSNDLNKDGVRVD